MKVKLRFFSFDIYFTQCLGECNRGCDNDQKWSGKPSITIEAPKTFIKPVSDSAPINEISLSGSPSKISVNCSDTCLVMVSDWFAMGYTALLN